MEGEEVFERLESMSTAADIGDFIESRDLAWKPLGGRDNNVGIVRSGSDPAQALTERITNGIDAILERAVRESGTGLDSPDSPRTAVEEWFGLSEAGYGDMTKKWVRETAEANLKVIMSEGADKDHPVIEIYDSGIGQKPENFPDTFLSLNEDSKIKKPYLIGKYGQGGSNTFDFCEYAIILSRDFEGGDIGWSIVRFNPRLDTEEEYSDGVFEYCVNPDGSIPSIAEEHCSGFEGSKIRLVEYDASSFNNSLAPGKESLYTVAHETMFGSLFPFILEDRRTTRFSYEGDARRRTIVGSRYRLDQPAKNVDESREFKRIDLGNLGILQVKYWVLDDTDAVSQFADKTHPIVFTLHGQKHHSEPKRTFKQTNYSFLKDRIIIEINCDDLSRAGKRVFSSTRDRVTKGEEYRKIKRNVIKSLKNDKKLERLEKKYKNKALSESTDEQEQRAKNLLADLLQEPESSEDGKARTDGGPDDGTGGGGGGGGGSRDPVEPRYEYPSFVEIDNAADPIEAKIGRTTRIRLKIDAKDEFDELDKGEIRLEFEGEISEELNYLNETTLSEGWKTFQFEVKSDTDGGIEGTVRAVVEWEGGYLEDNRDIEITEPPKDSGGTKAKLQAPEIRQVTADQVGQREALGWEDDEDAVVQFHSDDEGVGTVFVAMFNEGIQPIRETIETEGTVEQYDSQYAAYISYWEMMRVKDLEEKTTDPDEDYVLSEKNRTAKMLMRSISEGMSPEALGVV